MKKIHIVQLLGVGLLSSAVALGCGEEKSSGGIDAWQGETAHVAIEGKLNGEALDISISGEDAQNIERLLCYREYDVPTDTDDNPIFEEGVMSEMGFNIYNVMVDGEARDIQLEFKDHDFSADAEGDTLTVIPRNEDVVPAADELFVEWEWYLAGGLDADEDAYYAQSALEGTVVLELFSGEVGDDGLMIVENTGMIGIYADLYWSETEHIQMSISASCGPNDF